MKLAGVKDAVALTTLAIGGLMLQPWMFQQSNYYPAILGALGSLWIGWRLLEPYRYHTNQKKKEGFTLPSDEIYEESIGVDGIRLGVTKDNHLPVDLSNSLLQRHTAIVGQSGVGKTTLGEYLLWQQTQRGGGWIFIDAKLDKETRDKLAHMMKISGRPEDLYVLNISEPENSNSYNPILAGTPDEVASRLLNLIPSAEESPGADHYRQAANHALTVIIGGLRAAKKSYTFGDLALLLQSANAMSRLERSVKDPKAKRSLTVFLDQFRTGKDGQIDIKRLKEVLGGMSGRIAMFAQGNFGEVFNTYLPEIDLFDIITNNKCLYVMLPTMGSDTAALNLGKMIMSDLRSAVARIQELEEEKRPNPAYVIFADEMGSYVMDKVKTLFEQARSAGICMIPGFQSFSQLSQVSQDFADILIQNTWNKILFKFGSVDSADMAIELIGKEVGYIKTIAKSSSESDSSNALRLSPDQNESDGVGVGANWREDEKYRVSADQLRALGVGEAIVVSGARTFHIKTPMMNFPASEVKPFKVIRRKIIPEKGIQPLKFEENYEQFMVSQGTKNQGEGNKREGGLKMSDKTDKVGYGKTWTPSA